MDEQIEETGLFIATLIIGSAFIGCMSQLLSTVINVMTV